MSYSFGVKGATKAAVRALAEVEFDKMVVSQPIHAKDKAAALANLDAMLGLVHDDDSKDVVVSMNGYVSWPGGAVVSDPASAAAIPLVGACASASVYMADRVVTA
jgi:hypothetical protein